MTKQLNLFEVSMTMEAEGFDYCFRSYSQWEEVRDAKFHKLRQAYLDAAEALESYVKTNSQDPLEDWLED